MEQLNSFNSLNGTIRVIRKVLINFKTSTPLNVYFIHEMKQLNSFYSLNGKIGLDTGIIIDYNPCIAKNNATNIAMIFINIHAYFEM